MAYLSQILRQLPVFEAVAETGQIQRAAARLNIAQSAVSRRILKLEKELGVKLFERRATGARLTAGGEAFHAAIRRALGEIEAAAEDARRAMAGQSGRLRVGFIDSAARGPLLTRALKAFQRAAPDVELEISATPAVTLVAAIEAGDLDAGFVHDTVPPVRGLEYRPVWVHEQSLALPADHRLARKATLRLADLREENFIWPIRSQAPAMYERLASVLLRGEPSGRRRSLEIATSESMLALVSSGMGIGFVVTPRPGTLPRNVVLRALADFSPALTLQLAWRRGDRSAVLARFIDTVLAEAARSGGRNAR